jgi:5-methyltetrahydrofolate--homocysteine methyltransferase
LNAKEFYAALRDVDTSGIEELVKKGLAAGMAAQKILNEGLIGGMTLIGQEFKCRDLWVPDVLLAARNMHRGIDILKPHFAQGARGEKGKIVLGTVKGDIHDIGKNLVAIMMSGSGFEVVDLGIDISLERFLAAAEEHKPQIIGLSALLTTTMMEMEKVIQAVKSGPLSPKPKVMIGGAPVTEAFAREIGADGYGADAVSAVEEALKLVGGK